MDNETDYEIETILSTVFGGAGGAVSPPIVQTSLFTFDSYDAFEKRFKGETDEDVYTRVHNPTVRAFETMMAKLENGEAAVGFASGMAAISSTVLAFVKPGDHIACVEHVYPDSFKLFEDMLAPLGITTSYHPIEEFENNPDLLKGVKLAYLESPNSLMMQAVDLQKVSAHAKRHNVLTMIDNSWATPIFQKPLTLGIDIVIHSASKYISGHSDVVAGVVVSNNVNVTKIRERCLALLGGKLAPFEAWLLIRGLRSLHARMMMHQASANEFISRLNTLSCVKKINSPAPNSVPGLTGRSGLFSIKFNETVDIRTLCNNVNLFKIGVSWGGYESLILPTKITLAQTGAQNSMQHFNVADDIVRLSLGLENVEDLWADFKSALDKSTI